MRPETRAATLRFAVARGGRALLAMRGTSMLPTLREGMTLEVVPAAAPRLGDVLVFERGDRMIAHRVVAKTTDALVTSGDAQPHKLERVSAAEIIGVVASVRNANGAILKPSRFRELLFVLLRGARARDPRRRPRAFLTLFRILRAHAAGESGAIVALLRDADAADIVAAAARHGVLGLLTRALEGHEVPVRLREALTRHVLRTRARQLYFARQIDDVVRMLNEAGVPFALLKGAARVYAHEPSAALYDACDIDVLVSPRDLVRAVAALREHGYGQPGAALYKKFYARHHHTAPLVPPRGVPVEVHTRLCGREVAERFAELDDFRDDLQAVRSAHVLGDVAAAFHAAVHGRGVSRLRDVFVIADLLPRLNDSQRRRLAALAASAGARTELAASLRLGASLAGVELPLGALGERYLDWAFRREDLPRALRGRSQLIEALFAVPSAGVFRASSLLVAKEAGLSHVARMTRALGRVLAGLAAGVYALRLGRGIMLEQAERGKLVDNAANVRAHVG